MDIFTQIELPVYAKKTLTKFCHRDGRHDGTSAGGIHSDGAASL